MGRGFAKVVKGRSELDSKSRGDKKKMYQQRRGQGQWQHRGRGRGHGGGGRGRGGGGGYGGGRNKWLFENMSGFLCTCNMNEKDCSKEALNLLNEYLNDDDIPAPPSSISNVNQNVSATPEAGEPGGGIGAQHAKDIPSQEMETDVDTPRKDEDGGGDSQAHDDDDIEAALKAEIKELKSDAVRSRFFSVDTGVPNLIFIKSKVKDPSALATRIFEDVTAKKELKARFLLRLVPVEITCTAYMDQIEGICRKIFPKYFAGNFTTFQVVYKSRYNNNLERLQVIKLLASLVCEINPLNVVDLTNPTYSIVIEVIKNIVCIAVLKDFNKFKRYNLHEVVADESEKKPAATTTGKVDENIDNPSAENNIITVPEIVPQEGEVHSIPADSNELEPEIAQGDGEVKVKGHQEDGKANVKHEEEDAGINVKDNGAAEATTDAKVAE